MLDFFNGWRRKLGVLTLMMACVVMICWARSFPFDESVWFPTGKGSESGLISQSGFVVWVSFHYEAVAQPASGVFEWHSSRSQGTTPFDDYRSWKVLWKWNEFALVANESHGEQQTRWIAPYWSIVLPLTFISANLLLSKPRKSIQEKISEPTRTEGP